MPISAAKFTFHNEDETRAWARRYARTLRIGDCLALVGPMGAGKTTLVQGLAAGWGSRALVTSPTFALVNEYRSRKGAMYHMDMYRLSSKELPLFPLEDYLGDGLCVIEWADRVRGRLPRGTRLLKLAAPSDTVRTLQLRSW